MVYHHRSIHFKMMQRFKDPHNWWFDGTCYVNEIVYSGPVYAVSPGVPSLWEHDVNSFLKEQVYKIGRASCRERV